MLPPSGMSVYNEKMRLKPRVALDLGIVKRSRCMWLTLSVGTTKAPGVRHHLRSGQACSASSGRSVCNVRAGVQSTLFALRPAPCRVARMSVGSGQARGSPPAVDLPGSH